MQVLVEVRRRRGAQWSGYEGQRHRWYDNRLPEPRLLELVSQVLAKGWFVTCVSTSMVAVVPASD